jgi:hypothetical protein
MKAGIEWCAALCDSFLCLVLEYFSTVLPISTYESRDWVMCCSFVIPFFTFGLKSFSTVLQFYLWQSWVMCCSFVIPLFTFWS